MFSFYEGRKLINEKLNQPFDNIMADGLTHGMHQILRDH